MRPQRRPIQSPITYDYPSQSQIIWLSQLRASTYTDDDLTDHDTDNFQICHSGDPVGVALRGLGAPALGPGIGEKRRQVTDGEEDVTLQTKTSTGDDSIAEIPRNGRQRVFLHHGPDGAQLLAGSLAVDGRDEFDALANRQISPVGAIRGVAVVGTGNVGEDTLLVKIQREFIAVVVVAVRTVGDWDLAGDHAAQAMVLSGGHGDGIGKLCNVYNCAAVVETRNVIGQRAL